MELYKRGVLFPEVIVENDSLVNNRNNNIIKSPNSSYTESLMSKSPNKKFNTITSPRFPNSPLITDNRTSVMSNDIYSHNAANNNKYILKYNRPGSPKIIGGSPVLRGNPAIITSPVLRNAPVGTRGSPVIRSSPIMAGIQPSVRQLTNMEKVKVMKNKHNDKGDLRYDLIVEFSEGTRICPLCSKSILPTDKIWNCSECPLPTHLQCATEYAMKTKVNSEWKCPGCIIVHDTIPRDYLCFCEKVTNPKFNEYIIPHSCGNICGKIRPDCKHTCKDRCHPGPCNPCREPAGFKKCYCGRHSFPYLCGDPFMETRSCGEICGRLLNCGIHYCNKPCHPGPCKNCSELITESCRCGQELRFAICGRKNTYVDTLGRMFTFKNYNPNLGMCQVSCGRPCKRIRNDCGHVCGRICHTGRCTDEPCTSKCGKRKTCGHPCDRPCGHQGACDLEPCKSICGADKTCCLHQCHEICHYGTPCPEDKPCTEKIMAVCECFGQTFEMMCGATLQNPNLNSYIELVCNCPSKLNNVANETSTQNKNHTFAHAHPPVSLPMSKPQSPFNKVGSASQIIQ